MSEPKWYKSFIISMCEEINLNSHGGICIYLNHRKLINEAYKVNDTKYYQLRGELFNYQPIERTLKNETKRKRKSKPKITTCQQKTEHESIDVDLLLPLESIKAELERLVLHETNENHDIQRIWEELQSDDFPRFNGANYTNSFQELDSLVKEKRFLIPPNTRFYNYDVSELNRFATELQQFDLIVIDPPWRNKYIRRLKKHKLGYNMLGNENLQVLPVQELVHSNSLVAVWCTNSKQHHQALINDLLPAWNLRLLHIVKWFKLNTQGHLISPPLKELEQKQPYEHLFIACHQNAATDFGRKLKNVEFILSVPSIIHSHKPPLLQWLKSYLKNSHDDLKCLELFARYLQPHFTSFGLEVLKLMDKRLYKTES